MKYIIALSLSTLGLAAIVFVLQGRPEGPAKPLGGTLINSGPPPAPTIKKEQKPSPVPAGRVMVAAAADAAPVQAASKAPSTKSERLRKVVRDAPWDEAKPEVIRILNEEGGGSVPASRDKNERLRDEKNRKWHEDKRRDDDDGEDDD